MSPSKYPWKRFWCAIGKSVQVEEGAYLVDPDRESFLPVNSHLVTLDSLQDEHCLILLGEPGIGKSTVISETCDKLRSNLIAGQDSVQLLDLKEYGDESRLLRDLFQSQESGDEFSTGKRCYLFLDSFDECLLNIKTLCALFLAELRRINRKQLYIRIGCRTAKWPSFLDDELASLWPNSPPKNFELVALRSQDISFAASFEGIDPRSFLDTLSANRLQPLAAHPLSLKFLIKACLSGSIDSKGVATIYEDGCTYLCQEHDSTRELSHRNNSSSPAERLKIASAIAAFMLLCNKNTVWIGTAGKHPATALTFENILLIHEIPHYAKCVISRERINEVLDTSLFVGFGPDLLGFAHKSFMEFTAAKFFHYENPAKSRLHDLILSTGEQQRRLNPRLDGMLMWLVSLDPPITELLAPADLLQIVKTGGISLQDETREKLVYEFLVGVEDGRIIEKLDDHEKRLLVLNHPKLATQLRRYISRSWRTPTRLQAMCIARSCGLADLNSEILSVAQNRDEEYEVRCFAARVILESSDSNAKLQMKSLIDTEPDEDPDDEIRGTALCACWPEYMTVDELTDVLRPPRRSNLIGAYRAFIDKHLSERISPTDLPTVFRWLCTTTFENGIGDIWEELAEGLTERAWEFLDNPEILTELAGLILHTEKRHSGFLSRFFKRRGETFVRASAVHRHELARAILLQLRDLDRDIYVLLSYSTNLLSPDDIPWLITLLEGDSTSQIKVGAAKLVRSLYWTGDLVNFDAVIIAHESSPELASEFGSLSVRLNSDESMRQREQFRSHTELTSRPETMQKAAPQLDRLVENDIDRIVAGDSEHWIQLWHHLQMTPESLYSFAIGHTGVEKYPGWAAADDDTKARIIRCAKSFLSDGDPQTSSWIFSNHYHNTVLPGYSALLLIFKYDQKFVETLPTHFWKRWGAAILVIAGTSLDDDKNAIASVLRIFDANARQILVECFGVVVDREDQHYENLYSLTLANHCWSSEIGESLLLKARHGNLKPTSVKDILIRLFIHKHQEVAEFAESLLTMRGTGVARDRSCAVLAAQALFIFDMPHSWGKLWSAIEEDRSIGVDLFLGIVSWHEQRSYQALTCLTELQLSMLYEWLLTEFPPETDPGDDDPTITPRYEMVRFRGTVLDTLMKRGTPASVSFIENLVTRFPEYDWLRRVLIHARDVLRRETAQILSPEELVRLLKENKTRVIRDGRDLLELIIGSLGDLQCELQGPNPMKYSLWNNDPSRREFWPKDENHLSDYVVNFLKGKISGRAIAVNREVEIRRGNPSDPGQRADIYVEAFAGDHFCDNTDKITVVVEVKLDHNRGVMSDMKNQLVARYLKENGFQYGLYVVAQFECGEWTPSSRKSRNRPIDDLRRCYANQAARLSSDGLDVRSFVLDARL